MTKLASFLSIILLASCAATAPSPASLPEGDAPEAAVHSYHAGLIARDAARVRRALADAVVIVNGNFSDDPRGWQPHQYLAGAALDAWPSQVIAEAAPFRNEWQVVHSSRRGDAAVVVTVETGRNKLRTWNREVATWMLGRDAAGWRIVGVYVRDLAATEVTRR